MSLICTTHSIWDSSHKQIGRTQTKKKDGAKRYFKFQAKNNVCLSKIILEKFRNVTITKAENDFPDCLVGNNLPAMQETLV